MACGSDGTATEIRSYLDAWTELGRPCEAGLAPGSP